MPLDFPLSPTLNQVYSLGGKSWKWNGAAWETYNDNLGVDFVETVNGITGDVSVTGGTSISVVSAGKTLTVNYTGSGGGAGSQGATGATGAAGIRYLYNSGVTGNPGSGYFSGNYALNQPWGSGQGASNFLWFANTDYHGQDRSMLHNLYDSLPSTGVSSFRGYLYVQSTTRNVVSVFRVGSWSITGLTASGFTRVNWTSDSSFGSATGGTFAHGEEVAVFYVPGGVQGAQGAKGDPGTISSINGGELTVIE